jgi:hypothetical protein
MKSQQKEASGLQYARQFLKDKRQRSFRNVHNGIERGNSSECIADQIQRHHVSLPEGNIRIQALRFFDHFR